MTSSQLRHQNNITKIFHFGPLSIEISGYASTTASCDDFLNKI